jgi:hypothetical protein
MLQIECRWRRFFSHFIIQLSNQYEETVQKQKSSALLENTAKFREPHGIDYSFSVELPDKRSVFEIPQHCR